MRARSRRPLLARVLAGVAGLAVLGGAAGCGLTGGSEVRTMSADFDRAIGLYVHSDVRMLGIPIGTVTRITPRGTVIHVDMTYDSKYKIPADARAVIVAPSIVSDRYVQLTPVYTGGPVLAQGALLSADRTRVPVELDEIYAAFDQLNQALGPKGANRNGALSDLVHVGAQNLGGNGAALGATLRDLSQAVQTLDNQRGDLFGTVRNLQAFTTVIAQNDATVRRFNDDLTGVSAQLAGERVSLATAIKQLGQALTEVASFVRQNSKDLTANVGDLASITQVLVTQKKGLQEFLDTAPTALSNLQLAYNPRSGTLDTRDGGPANLTAYTELCNLLTAAGQPQSTCASLKPLLGALPGPGGLGGGGAPAPPTLPRLPGAASTSRDLTLGGILEAGK